MNRNRTPRAFLSISSLLQNDYDIIHLHTPIAAFLGRIAGRLKKVPKIIYTAHGFYFHDGMRFEKRLLFKSMELAACRLATDYLFCQSAEDTMTALKDGFINPDRIVHIGNGVDLERFKPDLDKYRAVRKKLKIPPDAVVVTFVGRMVKEKGILELLEAFRILSTLLRYSQIYRCSTQFYLPLRLYRLRLS